MKKYIVASLLLLTIITVAPFSVSAMTAKQKKAQQIKALQLKLQKLMALYNQALRLQIASSSDQTVNNQNISQSDWLTYASDSKGYSVQYPKEYGVKNFLMPQPNTPNGDRTEFGPQKGDGVDPRITVQTINLALVFPQASTITDLESWMRTNLPYTPTYIVPSNLTIAGQKVVRVDYHSYNEYYFTNNTWLYSIRITPTTGAISDSIKDKFFSSFSLLK